MADPIRFILLTENEAGLVRGTGYLGHSLQPRTVEAGVYAGRAVLPLAVLDDPAHAGSKLFLMQAQQANIDPDVAWPPQEL